MAKHDPVVVVVGRGAASGIEIGVTDFDGLGDVVGC
jgi:hypothetical protein